MLDTPRTVAAIRELDRRAIQDYGIPGIVLMENAGAAAARWFHERMDPAARVTIVCGPGNNGGDGFVIARHLHNSGHEVTLLLAAEPAAMQNAPDAWTNFLVTQAMHLSAMTVAPADAGPLLRGADAIIDALLGTGIHGDPREPFRGWIEAMNAAGRPVFAVDIPSGLDGDTGAPCGTGGIAVRAAGTATFAAMKQGFQNPAAARYTGDVRVFDIGIPREAYAEAEEHRL